MLLLATYPVWGVLLQPSQRTETPRGDSSASASPRRDVAHVADFEADILAVRQPWFCPPVCPRPRGDRQRPSSPRPDWRTSPRAQASGRGVPLRDSQQALVAVTCYPSH